MKQWTHREFIKLVESNGYFLKRYKGSHYIYENNKGRHISIPIYLSSVIARRLIKENKLK